MPSTHSPLSFEAFADDLPVSPERKQEVYEVYLRILEVQLQQGLDETRAALGALSIEQESSPPEPTDC